MSRATDIDARLTVIAIAESRLASDRDPQVALAPETHEELFAFYAAASDLLLKLAVDTGDAASALSAIRAELLTNGELS